MKFFPFSKKSAAPVDILNRIDAYGDARSIVGTMAAEMALSVAAVFACVRVISEDAAKLPSRVRLKTETGSKIAAIDFLTVLANAYAKWEEQFATFGFAPIREAWLSQAIRLGETITARTPNEEITGKFDTIDNSGALVLITPKGRRSVSAAEVFF